MPRRSVPESICDSSRAGHLDTAGVMANEDELSYLQEGMAAKPRRTLIEFLLQFGEDGA